MAPTIASVASVDLRGSDSNQRSKILDAGAVIISYSGRMSDPRFFANLAYL